MTDNINLIDFYNKFSTEQACRDYLQIARWGSEIICPHCGVIGNSYKYKSGKLFKCGACRQQFTVRVGTIFEDSKIPLQKWFLAVYLATSLKKGVSSVQLSKYLGITQKSAWYMLHRIRYALESGDGSPLSGSVEIDETYVGGKGYNRARQRRDTEDTKAVVMGMVERKGQVRIRHVNSSGARALLPQVQKHIQPGSQIYSDEYGSYKTLERLGYKHGVVHHRSMQFRKGDIHTQSVENLWSHFKRGIDGIYHHVSQKHLQKYCSEYEYRFNTRRMNDFERFELWFSLIGCRLTYNKLIGV